MFRNRSIYRCIRTTHNANYRVKCDNERGMGKEKKKKKKLAQCNSMRLEWRRDFKLQSFGRYETAASLIGPN